ncbi:hypothetical protein ACH4T9_12855 [Micromonospora sp. NPDC020750]|uniref:hypothetical protein n=1 Tax=unclassified Micromonospora TaxID=2617518 RepID=UPI0037A7437E
MYGYNSDTTTKVPAGETDYLAKAGDLLAKAAEANEQENRSYRILLIQGRERIAAQYAQLAAIQRGQLPTSLAKVLLDHLTGDPQ